MEACAYVRYRMLNECNAFGLAVDLSLSLVNEQHRTARLIAQCCTTDGVLWRYVLSLVQRCRGARLTAAPCLPLIDGYRTHI